MFKPDKTYAASFLNSFKNVCGRSTHLLNNPWVYYYFSGENQLQNVAMSLSNLKTLIKHI